jgi:hypothetical protein
MTPLLRSHAAQEWNRTLRDSHARNIRAAIFARISAASRNRFAD